VLRVSKCLEGDDGPTKTSTKVIFVLLLKFHIYHNYFIYFMGLVFMSIILSLNYVN